MNETKNKSRKLILCQKLLNNHEKNLITCFEKYRCFNEQNSQFRGKFYTILKKQIISSLNIYEKINLMQEIQHDIYSNPESNNFQTANPPPFSAEFTDSVPGPSGPDYHSPQASSYGGLDDVYSNSQFNNFYDVTSPFYTEYTDILPGPSGHDYHMAPVTSCCDLDVNPPFSAEYSNSVPTSGSSGPNFNSPQTSGYGGIEAHQFFFRNEPTYIPRSSGSTGDDDQELLKLKDLSISPKCKDYDDMNRDLYIVRQSFQRLSNLITNRKTIIEELDEVKREHGEHIYSRLFAYSPSKGEPILFQLALQLDTYELALDRLVDEDLLDLNRRNQYRMSIFNVLLAKDFHSFTKFLSYIDRKNLDHTIQHICLRNDYMAQLPETAKEFGSTSETKKLEIINDKGDEFMISKGIIYSRHLIKERNARIVTELLSHNYLHAVLNDQIGNEQPFLKQLAETYPDSDPEIQLIIKEDSDAVVHSPFIVWLALRNLNNFYVFLRDLINVIQINKRDLCRAIVDQNVDGKTIPTIIQADESKNRFPKSAKRIEEFILNYKSENAK